MHCSLSRTTCRRLLLCCILLFKGAFCTQWDPLPEEIRNAISSNHLSEVSPHGFEEYHGLLKEIRGDFGIKSKLVEAATKNPEYTGANTFVIPLYIPQGAIPLINNERSTRSGKGSSVRRILGGPLSLVRVLSKSESHRPVAIRRIIGRRPFGSRSSFTPHPISDPLLHDTVKAKIIKHNRRRPNKSRGSRNRTSTVSSDILLSTTSAPNDVTKIKKLTTVVKQKTFENRKSASTTPKLISKIIEIRKIDPEIISTKEPTSTEAYKIKRKASIADTIEKRILSTVFKTTDSTKIKETTTSIPISSPTPHIKAEVFSDYIKRSHKQFDKQNKERTVVKPVMPSPRSKIFATTESSTYVHQAATTTTTTSNTKSARRHSSLIDLRNRRRRLKERQKNNKKVVEEVTESIIDRVLNSAANQSSNLQKKLTTTTTESIVHTTESTTTTAPTVTPLPSTAKPFITTTKLVTYRAKDPISRSPIVSNPKRTRSQRPGTLISRKNYIYAYKSTVTPAPRFPVTSQSQNVDTKSFIVTKEPIVSSTVDPLVTTIGNNSSLPKDIVLYKLSELMKNASIGTRDSLSDIAKQLNRINEELAPLGIQITNAEFNGHIFKLVHNTQFSGKNGTFSEAFTKRYTIRNTTSSSNFKGSTLSAKNINTPTTARTTERSIFSLQHSESSSKKSLTPSSIPDLNSGQIYSNITRFLKNTTNTGLINNSPVTITTAVDKEYADSVAISASTIVPESESTRTRSTIVPINFKEVTEEEVSIMLKNTGIKTPKSIIPTAHLRPTSTTVDKTTTRKTTAAHLPELRAGLFPTPVDNNENEIMYNDNTVLKIHNATMLPSEYDGIQKLKNEVQESGSYIYFIAILGVIPCTAALVFLYRQRYKTQQKALPEREERAEGHTPPTHHSRPTCHNNTLDAYPGYIFKASERESPWEMTRSKLRITSVIGEGNFGIVWKAEVRNLCEWEEDGGPTVLVAVKGVKEGAGIKEKTDLLRELAIMKVLGQHNNIVTLLGCCTKQEPYYLVMEYVMFGKLLEFLREQRSKNNYYNFSSDMDHLTSRDLTKFASQIATGCEYLQSRGIIHRDLAARNILVDHNKICKIADFGLARSVKDTDNDIYEQKSKGPLPIRWMAPESTYMNIYTHKSDVWSFGILCWEIVTLGSTPYPGISAREVMRRVREGYRLERPEHCRPEFYEIVSKCWTQDIASRVSFTTIREELRELLNKSSGWIDLENFEEEIYYSMHQNNEEKL